MEWNSRWWKKIYNYEGTYKTLNGFWIQNIELTPGHGYTFLQDLEIDEGSRIEKVVKLRNQWENFEYSGDLSD